MEILISTNMWLSARREAPRAEMEASRLDVSARRAICATRRCGILARYKGDGEADHLTASSLSSVFERFTHQ